MIDLSKERILFMICGFLAHEIPLIAYQLFCDFIRKRGIFAQYLIQPKAQPPPELVAKATKRILAGHLGAQWVFLYMFYDLAMWLGMPGLTDPFPRTLFGYAWLFPEPQASGGDEGWLWWWQMGGIGWSLVWQVAVFILVCDTTLYWSHRTLHHPRLYARFHKQHHEFHSNVPLASEYFTPLEELTTGLIPTLLGPLLLRAHLGVTLLWLVLRVSESADAHCGYDLPFSVFRLGRPGDRHDFHHSHNLGNFGAFLTLWDSLLGTDQDYLRYKARQQHQDAKTPKESSKDS